MQCNLIKSAPNISKLIVNSIFKLIPTDVGIPIPKNQKTTEFLKN